MILKKGKELCFLMELFDKAIRKIKAKRKYQEALEFQRKGLYKEAEAAYRGVIELNPSFYKAYTNLGSVLFKNRKFQDPDCDKKFSEAVQCYEKALEIQPDDPISLFNLGTIHYENFDNEERAFDYFAQAINADPRSVQKIQQYLGWISYNSKEDFKKVVDRSMYLVTQKKIQESAAISQVKPDSRKEQKPVITSKNINPISLVTSIILTSLIMGVSWISDARSISTEPLYRQITFLALVFLILFIVMFFLVSAIFSVVFMVVPITPATYTNEKYGFSIRFPLEWEDATKRRPYHPEFVVHAQEKSGFAGINIIAGPQLYGPNPSINDIEIQARIHVENLHGALESLQRIKIDNIDAVMAVYITPPMKTKKVGLVKDSTEFIITCSSIIELFPIYDPIFDECLQSMKWKITK